MSEPLREAGPSGVQNLEQHIPQQQQQQQQQYRVNANHICQGSRCVCQMYENGGLAMAVMNRNRNIQERDVGYQNIISRSPPNAQSRPTVQSQLSLEALARSYSQRWSQQEPEENIYERLDNDDDYDDHNADARPNEAIAQNNQNVTHNHTYERIDDRISCRGDGCCMYHRLTSLKQYEQPRHIYLDPSQLSNQFLQNRLSRFGRNCFSTENIASASSRRPANPLGHNCMCLFCRHVDAKYICHYYSSLRNKLSSQDTPNVGPIGNSRHYIYHLPPKGCTCSFCRGCYSYKLFLFSSRKDCRNSFNCTRRDNVLSNSNSIMNIERYMEWINRVGSVNNPLYATIHNGRIDRSSVSDLSNLATSANTSTGIDSGASTSNAAASASVGANEPSTSSNVRTDFAPYHASTSNATICSMNRSMNRRYMCDDSCIRNQNGNVARICQMSADCNGRLSVHWWFVNKWLHSRNFHNPDRCGDTPPTKKESREQQESDSDDD